MRSVGTCVAELNSLAKFCNFGHTLKAILCDCIVCGINGNAIQSQLLIEPGVMFKKSLKIAQNFKATAEIMRELHLIAVGSSKRETSSSSNEINELTQQYLTQCINQKQRVDYVESQDTNQQTVIIKKQLVIAVVKLAI